MKRTSKYQLAYFEQGDFTLSEVELQRWQTLDVQLRALYEVMGNGVITGWDLIGADGLTITVTPGSGHVNFVAVESSENITVNLSPDTKNYVYATLVASSYWTKDMAIIVYVSPDADDISLLLGTVETDSTKILTVNSEERKYLDFIGIIRNLVSSHRHIGGTDNPPPVDLSSEVQGVIDQENLPDIDASKIIGGTVSPDVLPEIDHITKLINQGSLTHAQLDSFIEALNIQNPTLMGETSTVNLLQLILALKHIYPDIDQYLVNEFAFIPGISPDSTIDTVNTTAQVDTRPWSEGGEHVIAGTPAPAKNNYTKTWSRDVDFEGGTANGVYIDGDSVELATTENIKVIDSFSDINTWTVVTNDLSSVTLGLTLDSSTYVQANQSAKLVVSGKEVEMALVIKKNFDAEDWSSYNYIVFYLKTDSLEHGDVYFYINDAFYGVQDTYQKVLDKNAPTVNIDTLQNGWQEIVVDISSVQRSAIQEIGFFISTQSGWDTSKGLKLNIDKIYLTTGNIYVENGYIRVTFGGDFLYEFWRVRWNAIIPSDSYSTGVRLWCRTRVGNSLVDLQNSAWSAYTSVSGSDIALPSDSLYKYIEVEMNFDASDTYLRSAILKSLFLDFYVSDSENSFTYENKNDWDTGTRFNIDSTDGSLKIGSTEDAGSVFLGGDGFASQLNSSMDEVVNVVGSVIPISTYQVLNKIQPSFGLVSGVSRGDNGNLWLSDLDNDRVIEVDKSGTLIRGFYGSFLTPPVDVYGIEENGPGSNTDVQSETTTSTTTLASTLTTSSTTTLSLQASLNVLHSIYNPDAGLLYIIFDQDIENIYDQYSKLDMHRMYLKVGTQRFYLNDSEVTMVGVDQDKYEIWSQASNSTYTEFLNQFLFKSHALKIVLGGGDRTLLNHLVYTEMPSVVILTPYSGENIQGDVEVKMLLYHFELGSGIGENGIRITVDSGTPQDIYTTSITLSGLSSGSHTITAQLLNGDGTLNTNIEAIAAVNIVCGSLDSSLPYIEVTSPKPNQIYSSAPVSVSFVISNFPIMNNGQHLRYQVDGGSTVDHYSENSILIEDIKPGKHTLRVYMVDNRGKELAYTYGSVSANFIVGVNSNASLKLYVDSNAIYNNGREYGVQTARVDVGVGNIYLANIYAPIDVQVVPYDVDAINRTGLPSIAIAKMRSPSWNDGLGGSANALEIARRIELSLTTTTTTLAGSTTTTTSTLAGTTTTTTTLIDFTDVADKELIYGTKYLDGHSVVQMDVEGNVLISNNAAIFASTKDEAKMMLGSVEKLGSSEFLIGDSKNKRAIITYSDIVTQDSNIEWQYDSDRYIPDFHIVSKDEVVIGVYDDAIVGSATFIRQGSLVIWENNSASPISIYSGTTTPTTFNLDPDLGLYGDIFYSQVLNPGDRYAFKFVTVGDFDWFVYPTILLGSVSVTRNRISTSDQFIILESDGLDSPFSSRVIRVDSWGNVVWSFGEGYLVKPRDARPLINGGVIIST